MADLHQKEINLKAQDRHYKYTGQCWQNKESLQKEKTILKLQFFFPHRMTLKENLFLTSVYTYMSCQFVFLKYLAKMQTEVH